MEKTKTNFHFYDLHPSSEDMGEEVLNGLLTEPKTISPKFFYDELGSSLFDQICELPEYYPTRTEIGLLEEYGDEIAALMDTDTILIELGSGSSIKIRLLLDALRPQAYVPMDISLDHLRQSAETIARDYPWIDVHAACMDYSRSWALPFETEKAKRSAFFPGSSIGNFSRAAAVRLLQRVASLVGGGGLLIGVDLKKDVAILEDAYNDAAGVTAAFNLNLLRHINRELGADFDLEAFDHQAFYNEAEGRIEMHLKSLADQQIHLGDQVIDFAYGETIHSENSHKFHVAEFHELAAKAGFSPVRVWTDRNNLFSIHYLEVRD